MSENEEREFISVPAPIFDADDEEGKNLPAITALAVGLTKNQRNIRMILGISEEKVPIHPPLTLALSPQAAGNLELLLKKALRASLYGSVGADPDQLF